MEENKNNLTPQQPEEEVNIQELLFRATSILVSLASILVTIFK